MEVDRLLFEVADDVVVLSKNTKSKVAVARSEELLECRLSQFTLQILSTLEWDVAHNRQRHHFHFRSKIHFRIFCFRHPAVVHHRHRT